jgi:hypothetical protein
MNADRTPDDVVDRFLEELDHVERFVGLMRAKSTIHDRQVQDLNQILKRSLIPQLPRRPYDRIGTSYSLDETKELLQAIATTEPDVQQAILGCEQELDDIPSLLELLAQEYKGVQSLASLGMHCVFNRRFFQIVGAFGKQEKVFLDELGKAGSFEAFRDSLIEDQLKRRYVKDLLILLQSVGVELTDNRAGDRFVQLIELVLRRNLHIHNRGIVDQRYFETDPLTKKAKYNLFNLKFGDRALIDDSYFNNAIRLCVNCVKRLGRWTDE